MYDGIWMSHAAQVLQTCHVLDLLQEENSFPQESCILGIQMCDITLWYLGDWSCISMPCHDLFRFVTKREFASAKLHLEHRLGKSKFSNIWICVLIAENTTSGMNVPFIFDVYLHKGTQALFHECRILSYTDTHAHTYTHTYTHIHIYTHIYTNTLTDIRTCTHTHTHTHTTHTHAHTDDACTGIKTTLHLFDSINFFVCLTWRINMFDITHPCAWHHYFICVIWLLYKCDMTHSSVR